MATIRKFRVLPSLPPELNDLRELAHNLYWTWDHDIRYLFRRLEREQWETTGQNPVLLLGTVDQAILEMRAKDDSYLSHLKRAKQNLNEYLSSQSWFKQTYSDRNPFQIAYFSMEYGITNCLPIYSGGLGILAGDHLKSAGDLGLPLVGVGLLYQEGYFQQYLTADGWQHEIYQEKDFYNMPVRLERDDNKLPIKISVTLDGHQVFAQIWRAIVGRVPLFLLDTNIPENDPTNQNITDRLYAGDSEWRIKQEILLGIGGIRALDALGIRPQVCHMNEGHSAFLALERARMVMDENGLCFNEAQEATRGGNVFTSHTPIPAGIDEFDTPLVDRYLGKYYSSLNLSRQEFYKLGGVDKPQANGKFNMAIFAINMAGYYNGVSKLHGHIARKMWQYLWPEVPEQEVPLGHVTNGIHFRTWISQELAELFDQYLGPKWYLDPVADYIWPRVEQIPDEELWRTHERRREQLVSFARKRVQEQLENSGATKMQIHQASEVLDPKALTIGFSRRFASYKRATLVLQDKERLKAIVNNKERPVQFIFAGKAHPRDEVGKNLIRDIINTLRNEDFRQRMVFLEDYDMNIAAHLVQGVDVWLNNPIRPREASGTSGMKASANGVLNVSVLDGWWDEAYKPGLGWAIGRGEEYEGVNQYEQDRVEAEALYHLLEKEIIPSFYERGNGALPRTWIKMMKHCIRNIGPFFNTNRMVREYCNMFYIPAADRWKRLTDDNMAKAKELSKWKSQIQKNWGSIHFVKVVCEDRDEIKVSEKMKIMAWLDIGGLKPHDISVQIYYGHLDADKEIAQGKEVEMALIDKDESNVYLYEGFLPCETTGQYGYSVRVLPNHPELTNPHELGCIKWDESED